MKHLILCPEFPPAPIPAGGIGTYVRNIARLLAEAGETVHVIGTHWEGAPAPVEEQCAGRLILHRVGLDEPLFLPRTWSRPAAAAGELDLLARSAFPQQAFAWQAALLAEALVEREGIDVIEAQEWEAPLYYLQLRRALGEGPRLRPPCLVHLHSPTELIFRHNRWDTSTPRFRTTRRYENFTIAAADAHLCPSRFLARQAEFAYDLERGSVQVIPLPVGDFPVLARGADAWERGTICYVGRLEPRKGVIEWVDAAVRIAPEFPEARFEFVGADLPYTPQLSVRGHVEQRIPPELRSRFHFRGEVPRAELPGVLAGARIGVVPSRWENFPNTCVEAMRSGLPVIASREGGMPEMIEDGVTGWLTRSPGADALAETLRRALATPAAHLSEMGTAASVSIRQTCENSSIVERHLAFREQVSTRGAHRSVRLPLASDRPGAAAPEPCPVRRARGGIAIVITGIGAPDRDIAALIDRQIVAPHAVRVADPERGAAGLNEAVRSILARAPDPIGIAFLDAALLLQPEFTARCEAILRRCSRVGLIGPWVRPRGDGPAAVPTFPTRADPWFDSDAWRCAVARTEAVRSVGRPLFADDSETVGGALVAAALNAGWVVSPLPEILATTTRPAVSGNESRSNAPAPLGPDR